MRLNALPQAASPQRIRKAVPPIAVWLAASLLLHIALMLWQPSLHLKPPTEFASAPPLSVELRPVLPAEPTPPPVAAAPPPPAVRTAPPPKPKPPPVIALDQAKPGAPPAFTVPAPAPKVEEPSPELPPPVAKAAPPTPENDFATLVDARRRARGEAPFDAPSLEVERANRGALNSARLNQPLPTNFAAPRRQNGYGSFEIRRRGYDYAEYLFRGWNENFRREGLELIEVRQGNHSTIDIAVIRSMIEIIRRTENGTFSWQSRRLGRALILSAHARDNASLEEFLLKEFQDDLHRYR
jgi:hypothetical protein